MEAACSRSPLLAHWAELVAAACRFLELDCHAAAGCDPPWLPLSLAVVLMLLAAVAGASCLFYRGSWRLCTACQLGVHVYRLELRTCFIRTPLPPLLVGAAAWRWLAAAQARDGARMVAVSATVLKELRKAAPQQYPSERHMFTAAAEGSLPADPLQPLLCAVCLGDLSPAGGGPAPSAQACAACGTLTHDGCVRRAGKTCRPLCCGADHSRQQHFWQAWGTVLEEVGAEAAVGAVAAVCSRLWGVTGYSPA